MNIVNVTFNSISDFDLQVQLEPSLSEPSSSPLPYKCKKEKKVTFREEAFQPPLDIKWYVPNMVVLYYYGLSDPYMYFTYLSGSALECTSFIGHITSNDSILTQQ